MIDIEEKKFTNQDGNTVVVFKPKGRLDITISWEFRLRLQKCIFHLSCHIFVNLSQVMFIDSTGLNYLVAGMRDAHKANVLFRICNLRPETKLVTMMDMVLKKFESKEEALNNFFTFYS